MHSIKLSRQIYLYDKEVVNGHRQLNCQLLVCVFGWYYKEDEFHSI